jgi:Fur family ferric uptake transcriptional regulator
MNDQILIDQTLRRLKDEGYKITAARRAVVEALVTATDHLTAPQIVDVVDDIEPTVGRASVYRTLDLLSEMGLVQLSSLGGSTATYMLNDGGHHHHVICTRCHKSVEFDDCSVRGLEQDLARRFGFEIDGHLVELYGRCPECQTGRRSHHHV